MIMTDNPILIDKSTMIMIDESTMIMIDRSTMIMTDKSTTIMTDKSTMTMTDNPIMIDESTMIIIDNPIMIDKWTLTIDEDELNIFLHAAKVLNIYNLEILGIIKRDFNIPNYKQKRKNAGKYCKIVHEFIKKYSNYSITY